MVGLAERHLLISNRAASGSVLESPVTKLLSLLVNLALIRDCAELLDQV